MRRLLLPRSGLVRVIAVAAVAFGVISVVVFAPNEGSATDGAGAGSTGYDPAVTSLTMPPGGTIYYEAPHVKKVSGTLKNEGDQVDGYIVTLRAEYTFDFQVFWQGEAGDTVVNGQFGGGNTFYSELSYVELGGLAIDPGETVPVTRNVILSCPNPSLNFLKSYQVTLTAESEFGDDNPADSQMTGSRSHSCVADLNGDQDGDTIGNWEDSDDDGDGCPDYREKQASSGSQLSGGLRDQRNRYDYFNPTHDGENRIDDVLAVVGQYFEDQWLDPPTNTIPNPNYDPDTDRTDDPFSSEEWDLDGPNGQQRIDDILAIIKQYFHDCS